MLPFSEAPRPLERHSCLTRFCPKLVTCCELDHDARNIQTWLFCVIGIFFFFPEALAVAFQGSSKNLGQVRLQIITVPLCLCPLI